MEVHHVSENTVSCCPRMRVLRLCQDAFGVESGTFILHNCGANSPCLEIERFTCIAVVNAGEVPSGSQQTSNHHISFNHTCLKGKTAVGSPFSNLHLETTNHSLAFPKMEGGEVC